WRERFMNYLEEQTDGEAMTNSIQNEKKTRKIDHLARSLLIQGISNDIYSLIDSNETAKYLWDALERQMRGFEYGEQDRKAAILYKYETFKDTEGEQLLDTYLHYLQVINDLKKCGYKKDKCDVNDALGYKKKVVVVTSDPLVLVTEKTKSKESDDEDISDLKKITTLLAKAFNRKKYSTKPTNNNLRTSSASFSANKKPEYVKSVEKKKDKKADEKKMDMSKVKCYNCKKEGHFAKDYKKAKVKDYNYYKTKMLRAKKDSDEQVLLAEDQAWMESSSDFDQEINANMVFMAQIKKVLSNSEESSSSAEETIVEVAYYTSESEKIFHDAIQSASENFIENHIDSRKDYDKSEVDRNDSEEKEHLVDKLIRKFNHKIAKYEASEVLISFIKKTQVNLQLQVQRVRTDNGTEFKNKTLVKFFDEVGISQQFSAPRTPQQNGVVERRNRTLVEPARTMLTFANLPLFLWTEAIATACFTQNRSIIHKRFDKTPYELMNKRKPNIKFFHVFGCKCYLLNDYDDVGKLKAKGGIGVFVGYSKESTSFRIYNKRTRKIHESVHVNFDEISEMASKQFSLEPEKYAKLEAERYEYMIRYSAYFDNDKQHRKQIADQEVLYDKMSVQLVELDKHTVHIIMPSKDTLYNGRKRIGFENPNYFEKAKDLKPSLYDKKVIGLGYTSMFLTHSNEALEIEKFKRARENKVEFAYDYRNLNASYQTSSLKSYVSTVILEKIIIDLEDEVVSLLEKKANLETIESLKSKGFESSENAISKSENQSENDCHVIEKECDKMENLKMTASGIFKLDLDTFSSVRRPKSNGVIWKKKGSSNNSNVDLSSFSQSKLNKDVKRYSLKDLLSCNNSHLGETSSAYVCNDAMNVSCNSRLCDSFYENNLFIFDDESIVHICLWIIDLGCSKHMTGNRALLTNFVEMFLETVHFGNNDFAVIAGYGNVVIGSMTIKKVYYVEGLGHNLFSVGQFCDKGLEVAFRKSTCFVRNEYSVDLLTGDRSSNLYTIALNEVASNSSTCLLAKASSSQSWLWHQRLSHLNFTTINNLVKNNLVQGLPKMKFKKYHLCFACEQGKIHRKHHKSKTDFASNKPLYLLHMDLYGPMRVKSINEKRYVLVVVDDYSRYTWRVRTDNGMIKNKTLAKFFDEVGISQQFSATRTPQQNGVVERRNRTLVEAARTMLIFVNLPSFLWAEAIATACFTQNHSIIHKRFDKTPYELMKRENQTSSSFVCSDVDVIFSMTMRMLESSRQKGILECLLDIQKILLLSKFTTIELVRFTRA
nr:retrovirus-related Pol polyprotein from transposon TNT 1-94 [Tanacetum cinerariifolium]